MEDNKYYYLKAESKLLAKKEELFLAGDTTKWELTSEDEQSNLDFIKDKEIMFPKMLPTVNFYNYNRKVQLLNN